ncbi:MAG TPA: branched-chain amino acid ABC transporter substrate-binding protein [Candidatus Dormibacteraeota bacterium]|nr:branched-chain amino acid ABC transporter substrate-binding protein [Candidatus Dormibacteraeota bacterium]
MERNNARLASVLAAVALTLVSSCGGSGNVAAPGPLASCKGTVGVASDLPTSGEDAAMGGPVEKAVRLAVDQATAGHLLGGCTLKYTAMDDASPALGRHDPIQGAQNVTTLVADHTLVGIVGPFNTTVATEELKVTNKVGVVQISPSTTDPGLTVPATDPAVDTASLRPSGRTTFFRVIANDIAQAQVMAQVAGKDLNLRKIYDISDQEAYGSDMSDYFDAAFTKAGGAIVKRVKLSSPTTDFGPMVVEAQGLAADGVFFGGLLTNGAGLLRKQMADAGFHAQFLSDDGVIGPKFISDAGTAAEGAQAATAPNTAGLPSAQQFVRQYQQRYGENPGAYSTYAYDCMNILLNAIHDVLVAGGAKPPADLQTFRSQVAAKVQATDYKGTIGETRFDANGDTLNTAFAVYAVEKGHWVERKTLSPAAG